MIMKGVCTKTTSYTCRNAREHSRPILSNPEGSRGLSGKQIVPVYDIEYSPHITTHTVTHRVTHRETVLQIFIQKVVTELSFHTRL